MRIGVAKPDHGIVGGFERVVDEVERGLTARGHTVERLVVPVRDLDRLPFGVRVAAATWRRNPEWFEHLRQVEAFLAVDASRFDVVLSTQPPSYAIRHPRHVSIFFHHLRRFYDLAGPIVDAGLVDRELHGHAARQIRRVDRPLLDRVGWFLAGSGAVAARLAEFNGIRDRVSVFHAGLGFRAGLPPEPGPPGTGAICVIAEASASGMSDSPVRKKTVDKPRPRPLANCSAGRFVCTRRRPMRGHSSTAMIATWKK